MSHVSRNVGRNFRVSHHCNLARNSSCYSCSFAFGVSSLNAGMLHIYRSKIKPSWRYVVCCDNCCFKCEGALFPSLRFKKIAGEAKTATKPARHKNRVETSRDPLLTYIFGQYGVEERLLQDVSMIELQINTSEVGLPLTNKRSSIARSVIEN